MSGQDRKGGSPDRVAGMCRRAGTALPVLATMLVLTGSSAAALAGQRQAIFQVGLRIEAALVERDLRAISTERDAARARAATTATTNNNRTGGDSGTAISRLRRADGSGWCVKLRLADGRARWRCD